MVNPPLHPIGAGPIVAAVVAWMALAGPPLAAAEPAFIIDLPGGGWVPGEFVAAAAGEGPRETLPWRAPQFVAPLEFRLDEIVGVRSASAAAVPAAPNGFTCRLRGGDSIDGELQSIDATHVVLALPGEEPVRVARGIVTGLGRRLAGGSAGYVGPGGLVGWEQSPASSWRDEAGRITTDVANAAITRDVAAPARARYDIVLSWRTRPELTLSVAAGNGERADPFRLEMLAARGAAPVAMLVRQEPAAGMLEPVPLPDGEQGRLRLTLFVDQAAGRLVAAIEGQEELVDLSVPPAAGRGPSSKFRLLLMAGDVCLEQLRVTSWKSALPQISDPEATEVTLRDGSVLAGEAVSLERGGALAVQTAAGEQTRPVEQLESIAFAVADEALGQPDDGDDAAKQPQVRAVRRSGGVLTGSIVAVTDGGLVLAHRGLDRSVTVPFGDLHSLVSLVSAEPRSLPGRRGILKLKGMEVPGCLVDAVAWGGGLAWQPQGSTLASPLAGAPDEVSAIVEYVPKPAAQEQTAGQVEIGGIGAAVNLDNEGFFALTMLSEEGAAARDGRIMPGDRIVGVRPVKDGPFVDTKGRDLAVVMNLLRGRVGTPVGLRVETPGDDGAKPRLIDLVRGLIYVAERDVLDQALAEHARVAVAGQAQAGDQSGSFPSLLVLRSGDVVPAAIERIDASGVRLRSPVTAGDGQQDVTVPNDLVRAIELDPSAGTSRIPTDRFQRLLTLPRSQQDDPPTHLLRLGTQDYLRGQLESLSGDEVVFSVLGQKKRLPRAAVPRIIWLHPEEIDFAASGAAAPMPEAERGPDETPKEEGESPVGLLVQGVSLRGRTTLVAERFAGQAIVGVSPAFGPSRIDTTRIDKLLVGRAVGDGEEGLPFGQWRLRLAPLPRALRDEE